MQFTMTGEQADSLARVLDEHIDGEAVMFTKQGDGTIVVAFSLATVEIGADGTVDEQ